jgi:hypothetical protein
MAPTHYLASTSKHLPHCSQGQYLARQLDGATHKNYLAAVGHILAWIIAASKHHPDKGFMPLLQTSALPFLKLLLLLDPLLLHKPQPSEPQSPKDAVNVHLSLFQKGLIS